MVNTNNRGPTTMDGVLARVDAAKKQHEGRSALSPRTNKETNNMATVKKVLITVLHHEALKAKVVEGAELKKKYNELVKKYNNLKNSGGSVNAVAALEEEINDKNTKIMEMETQIAELELQEPLVNSLTAENTAKDKEIALLKQQLEEVRGALVTSGGVDETKLNTELVMHTENAAKTALFRTWKFIENEEDLVQATEEVIPYLLVELEIPKAEYIYNYKGKVCEAMSKARQYVQSEAKKRALEWWTKNKTIPMVEDIFKVLNTPTAQLAMPENKLANDLLLWYVDRFLPIAAGKEYFGEDIRFYQRMTSKTKINGGQKICVTVASEAFGLLVLDNCRLKWLNIFQLKEKHGNDAEIPTNGPEYEPFRAKYTDSKCGRVKFGGWSEEGYAFYEEVQNKIDTFRANDEANNFDTQNYALKIVREKHGIAQEAPGKKRKRSKKTKDPKPVAPRKITRREE